MPVRVVAYSPGQPGEEVRIGRGDPVNVLAAVAAAVGDRHRSRGSRHYVPGGTELFPTFEGLDGIHGSEHSIWRRQVRLWRTCSAG